jgi:hypothetical protein
MTRTKKIQRIFFFLLATILSPYNIPNTFAEEDSAIEQISVNPEISNEITIQDTSGTIRAQGDIEQANDGSVSMTVEDTVTGEAAADGIEITLTPVSGGAAITGITSGGQVIFTGLAAGSYTVASTSAITFTSITVSTGAIAAGGIAAAGGSIAAVGSGVAGVAAVGGGSVALASTLDDSSDEAPLSPIR